MSARTKVKARHTRGPWKVGATGERGDGVWVEPPDGRENVICDIVGRLYDPEADCTQITDEDLANARLIAAAPTMFEVLRRLVPPDRPDLWSLEMFRDEEALERQIKEMWAALGIG